MHPHDFLVARLNDVRNAVSLSTIVVPYFVLHGSFDFDTRYGKSDRKKN